MEDKGKDVRRPGLQEEERRKGQVSEKMRWISKGRASYVYRVHFEVGVL